MIKRCGLLLLLLFGCHPHPAPITVARVLIDAPREFDDRAQEREIIRGFVQKQITHGNGRSRWVKDTEATHLVRLTIGVNLLRVRLEPQSGTLAFEAYEPLIGRDLVPAVKGAFSKAWEVIAIQRILATAKDDALIAALQHEDKNVVSFAATTLGERRSKVARLPMIELLKREDTPPDLALKIIGALVEIGDPQAVPALIDLTKRANPPFVVQIVFAVAAIGGPEAEGFLYTLASGHPDPNVQKSAQDAISEMKKRRNR
jgi:hypothetical protein